MSEGGKLNISNFDIIDVPGDAIAVEEREAEEKDRQDPDKRISSMHIFRCNFCILKVFSYVFISVLLIIVRVNAVILLFISIKY